MAHSLAEALAKAGAVKKDDALFVEEMRRDKLRALERAHASCAAGRAFLDAEAAEKERRFLARAAKETVRPGGNTASKAYLERFRK